MFGFIIKLFVCPIMVMVSFLIFPNVFFTTVYQPIIVGLILAIAGHTMEHFILKRGTLWLTTIVDFVAATFIVFFVSLFFAGAIVTVFGAMLTSLLLTFTELIQHNWLIKSGRAEKSPT